MRTLRNVILSGDGCARSAQSSESKNPYSQDAVESVGIHHFVRNDNAL